MSKTTFEELSTQVFPHHKVQSYVAFDKKMLLTIWLLAKPESFLAVGERFGVSKSAAHFVFLEIISLILHLKDQYIRWPNRQEIAAIETRFKSRSGIPGIVGAIDGTHIIIKQPINNPIDYYNRKEQHSVILQAVCDDKCVLTDIFVGMPGRMHDARVFRNSPLFQKLRDHPPLLLPHQHILGDAAYPLMTSLLKPYLDNGHLTRVQSTFNVRLNSQRSAIERAFSLLKGTILFLVIYFIFFATI
ncbi:uncharacterized protein [Onthophagus taurus]|uniref:uncharacterized protein n=1 Tax=Onthophagus taurus TaxID=166361 RepID=UPI0039BEC1B4